jgi:hypothetical protein
MACCLEEGLEEESGRMGRLRYDQQRRESRRRPPWRSLERRGEEVSVELDGLESHAVEVPTRSSTVKPKGGAAVAEVLPAVRRERHHVRVIHDDVGRVNEPVPLGQPAVAELAVFARCEGVCLVEAAERAKRLSGHREIVRRKETTGSSLLATGCGAASTTFGDTPGVAPTWTICPMTSDRW